jgi:Spy/CpxP family protein refolding chaperone
MRTILIVLLVAMVSAYGAAAQEEQPYAGWQARPIKALSDEEIADLKAGRGMELALAAELNGYPGPRHVIDLAEPLKLTEPQLAEFRTLFAAMLAETVPLGEMLIAQEAELDGQFSDGAITVASLNTLTDAIGDTQAALRAAHLRYHLAARDALTPEQTLLYMQLRGYEGNGGEHEHRSHPLTSP